MNKKYQNELLYPEILWERPVHYYKYHGGRIFIIAGSSGSAHRASIVCEAVFRSGTGIITLGFPDILKHIYKDFLPEEMTLMLPTTPGGTISQKSFELISSQAKASDVLLIGVGISENAETVHLTWDIITKVESPVVICEDAITALIKGIEVIRKKENEAYLCDYFAGIKGDWILVVTQDEISKIMIAASFTDYPKPNLAFVKRHKEELCSFLSITLGVVVILNDQENIICLGENVIVTPTEMVDKIASDLLAGIVSSFIGQNPEKILEASSTAVFLLYSALSIAKQKLKERIVSSSDILRELPEAIKLAEND